MTPLYECPKCKAPKTGDYCYKCGTKEELSNEGCIVGTLCLVFMVVAMLGMFYISDDYKKNRGAVKALQERVEKLEESR